MRKLTGLGLTVMAIAAAATASATPVVAPPKPIVPVFGCTSEYVVQTGDNLWNLAELKLKDAALWGWLYRQNPILQDENRYYVRPDGMEVVRIYPGEKLYCLEDVGVSLESNLSQEGFDEHTKQFVTPTSSSEKTFIDFLGDWWWLLVLAVLSLIAWLIYRESRKDPVNSGPPQVNGGVQNLEAARTRFESQAHQQHFTVLNVVPGTIHGTMMVKYGDGTERPRALNGERAFQATIRRADGQVENTYMLMACGNDLRYGSIARYIPGPDFRFVPDTAEATSPAQSAPAETSSAANTETSTDVTKPELKVELKPAEGEGGTAMLRVTGVDTKKSVVVTVTEDSFTLRFEPPQD